MTGCSVIMPSYYTGQALFASIKSVLAQRDLAQLIVVDNGNPLDALARLQQMALTEPRLLIISGHGNIGHARACNLGARQAQSEFLLFLKPDCLLPPHALVETVAAFDATPQAMLAGCVVQNPDGSEACRHSITTPKDVFRLAPAQSFPVSLPFLAMRRTDFERMLGFNEELPSAEDLDLAMRVQAAGGQIICVPSLRVTQILPCDSRARPSSTEWQKTRSLLRYFHKHFRRRFIPGFLYIADAALLSRFLVKQILPKWKTKRVPMLAVRRLAVLACGLANLLETRELEGKTVLVTGATGSIGLCLVRRLLASGASVLALSRSKDVPFSHERLRWLKVDLARKDSELPDVHIDMALHCAPLYYLPPLIERLAHLDIKRIVAFGSTSIFARVLSRNAYEKDLATQWSLAEAQVAERCSIAGINWTILRPTLVYGVGLDHTVTLLAKIIRRLGFFVVYPPALGRRQPVHADDIAAGAMQALLQPQSYGKSYNVSGGEIVTYHDMVERLFRLYFLKNRIYKTTLLPFLLDLVGGLMRKPGINGEIARRMNDDFVFFHDDAKRDFGFSPRSYLSGGIKDLEGF